jgi:protein disulfide-isomerase
MICRQHAVAVILYFIGGLCCVCDGSIGISAGAIVKSRSGVGVGPLQASVSAGAAAAAAANTDASGTPVAADAATLVTPAPTFAAEAATRRFTTSLSTNEDTMPLQHGTALNAMRGIKGEKKHSRIVNLKGEAFDRYVRDPERHVFVRFYTPWCEHCHEMEPAWKKLAEAMPHVTFGEINGEEDTMPAHKYKVKELPVLILFTKEDKSGMKYAGARDVRSMRAFIETMIAED